MFIGTYYYNIDDKGRIAVPPKYREALSGELVLARTFDKSVAIYTIEEWNIFVEKLSSSLGSSNRESRLTKRFFLSGAHSLELDKQGRLLLPAHLREEASLDREAVIVGIDNHLEIWDATKFEEAEEDIDIDEIEAFLDEKGISF